MKNKDAFDHDLRVRFRGLYDYDGLISLLRSFFDRAKMVRLEPKFKFKEGGNGAEIEFKFTGDLKVTHYIKIFMTIEGKGYDVKRKEVAIQGKKKIMTDGKIEIKFQGEFQLDYPGIYDEKKGYSKTRTKALKQMQDYLENPEYGIAFGDHKGLGKKNIQKLIRKFHQETKEFLGMECA